MYSQNLYNGLVNIVPFWSANIIQILGIGIGIGSFEKKILL